MGYGKKSDFTKDLTVSPGSSKYDIKTIFDNNVKSKKGFSIYESREVFIGLTRNLRREGTFLLTL